MATFSIYVLTDLGRQIAGSPHNADDPVYRVIYYLNRAGRATPQEIAQQTGVGFGTIAMLARKKVIMNVTEGADVPA
jgi:uncharacterized protein YdbL (DUF1318 family)